MAYYYTNDGSNGKLEIWINGSFYVISRPGEETAIRNIKDGDRITIIKEDKYFKRVINEFPYFANRSIR